MNIEFKQWLELQTYSQLPTFSLYHRKWRVIQVKYDKPWNWQWDEIIEWSKNRMG